MKNLQWQLQSKVKQCHHFRTIRIHNPTLMESPPSGAGLTSSGHWESPGAEGSACLVSSLCTRRHLVPQSELAVNTKRCSKYLEQWSPPTAFSKGQPLLCPQAHSLSTGLCGATWAAMWCSTDWPYSPSAFERPLLSLLSFSFSSLLHSLQLAKETHPFRDWQFLWRQNEMSKN